MRVRPNGRTMDGRVENAAGARWTTKFDRGAAHHAQLTTHMDRGRERGGARGRAHDERDRGGGDRDDRDHGRGGDRAVAKNVIFMVGDGLSIAARDATRLATVGKDGQLQMDSLRYAAGRTPTRWTRRRP